MTKKSKTQKMNILKMIPLLLAMILISMAGELQSQTGKTTSKNNISNQKTKTMKTNNEIIVDVRTTEEFQYEGHADCSVNYPLDRLQDKIEDLKKYNHVILVCRSGGRASVAKRMLENAGIRNVDNLGPWQNVSCAN
jgi:phage shock protein E